VQTRFADVGYDRSVRLGRDGEVKEPVSPGFAFGVDRFYFFF
jgi:hypothetical protein